jgi:hypothetical protein
MPGDAVDIDTELELLARRRTERDWIKVGSLDVGVSVVPAKTRISPSLQRSADAADAKRASSATLTDEDGFASWLSDVDLVALFFFDAKLASKIPVGWDMNGAADVFVWLVLAAALVGFAAEAPNGGRCCTKDVVAVFLLLTGTLLSSVHSNDSLAPRLGALVPVFCFSKAAATGFGPSSSMSKSNSPLCPVFDEEGGASLACSDADGVCGLPMAP